MPGVTRKSDLLARLGPQLQQAHEEHKGDETVYGNQNLPAGIENGVAQLVDCKFTQIAEGKENAGKYVFYAAGVVQLPEFHEGIKVRGLRTQISEPLYDTPTRTRKTVSDHLGHIYNELRKLGLDTDSMRPEDLEESVAALKAAAPHFKFRTWKGSKQEIRQHTDGKWRLFNDGKPDLTKAWGTEAAAKQANPYAGRDPMVNHQWGGLTEVSSEAEVPGVEEGGEDGVPTPVTGRGATSSNGALHGTGEEAPGGESFDEFGDIDSLVARATEGEREAQDTLTAMAQERGLGDAAAAAEDWQAVGDLIMGSGTAGGGDEEEPTADEEPEEPAAFAPEMEGVYDYKPILTDPKTKKKMVAKRPSKCEVIAIDARAKTVTLKRLDDPKIKYQKVPWDAIEPKD